MTVDFEHAELLVVEAWGRTVGTLAASRRGHVFEYAPTWADGGVELAPLTVPNAARLTSWPRAGHGDAFHRLPPFVADSLPESYGDTVMDAYLASRGMSRDQLTALDRLAYIGDRGMGALTFRPARPLEGLASPITLAQLVASSRAVVRGSSDTGTIAEILPVLVRISGSAGGAQAKALVSFRLRGDGSVDLHIGVGDMPMGFRPGILKLSSDTDGRITQPGRVEAAYARMAATAGIEIPDTLVIEHEAVGHYLVARFDRSEDGTPLHLQTLAAATGLDVNDPRGYEYAVYLNTVRALRLPEDQAEEAFRRIVFNVKACVRDDHIKNFAFLCDQAGTWRLAPAYDLTFTPKVGLRHQTHVLGKAGDIADADLVRLARIHDVADATTVIDEVRSAVERWDHFAGVAGVPAPDSERIREALAAADRPR